jgi:catechol 2,3-dioxygenase-like lactoylglutathione lyase family enzyme
MLGKSDLICFAATTDTAAALAFYTNILGLTLTEDSVFALVFDANGTMLRLQKVQEHDPPPFTALGWRVDDIAATAAALIGKGVQFQFHPGMNQDKNGVWTTPDGAKVAWFNDPDGNTLSLTEWPA